MPTASEKRADGIHRNTVEVFLRTLAGKYEEELDTFHRVLQVG